MTKRQERFVAGAGGKTEKEKKKKKMEKKVLLHEQSVGKQRKKTKQAGNVGDEWRKVAIVACREEGGEVGGKVGERVYF